MNQQNNLIQTTISELLSKLCLNFKEIQIIDNSDFENGVKFIIQTDDSGLLIGNEGATINAFNHLLKKIIWRKNDTATQDKINFFVDVNDYQSQNIEKIKQQALEIAKKVDLFKRDIEMDAQNSYERMIVHSVLADFPNVSTESTGEGELRRVVVRAKTPNEKQD